MIPALALAFALPALASPPASLPRCAVYGFDPKAAVFADKSPGEIAEMVRAWGADAVFGGWQDAAVRDALQTKGVRVLAELACFQGKHHWKEHPESRPIAASGKPMEPDGWYAGVCPSQDWLVERLERRARELVRKHKVDGVWLDFIRYPAHWEVPRPRLEDSCFCPVCIDRFGAETGARPPSDRKTAAEKARWILDNQGAAWARFKSANIAAAARRIASAARKASPRAVVGAFTAPWDAKELDGALTKVLGQDPTALGREVDVVSPMAYHALLERPPQWIRDAVATWAKSGKPVWPVVYAGEPKKPLGHDEFEQALKHATAAPSRGVIVLSFPAFIAGDHGAALRAACLHHR